MSLGYVGRNNNLNDLKDVAFLHHTIKVWGIGGDDVGLMQSTKAPEEAWSFYKTISCVRLCWELEEPKGPKGQSSKAPKPLAARREPSALEGWVLEVLYCNPKGSRAFLQILSTEGRGVRLCWARGFM